MARTRLVRERDSLARQVRELRGQRNAADARYDDEVRRHTACAEAWLKRGLENQALATERDAMRTERDRALGSLECAEAATTQAELSRDWWRDHSITRSNENTDLRAAIVKLACLLAEK